jgi:polysaccharide biosynthesis/export protein
MSIIQFGDVMRKIRGPLFYSEHDWVGAGIVSVFMLMTSILSLPSETFAQQPIVTPSSNVVPHTIAASGQESSSSTIDERYRIGPGDILDIRVFNRPQLSRDAVRVDGRGFIRMPLIEDGCLC